MMRGSGGIELQRIIELSVRSARGLSVDIPVRVVAEYPAHLPAPNIQGEDLTGVLTSLITRVLHITKRPEVKVRVRMLTPLGIDRIPLSPRCISGVLEEGGPWISIEITDRDEQVQWNSEVADPEVLEIIHPAGGELLSVSECRELIQRTGGQFLVDYQPEEGFQCWILMTLHASGDVHQDLSDLYRAVETHVPDGKGERKTLILLSDNDELRSSLAEDLVSGGYRVVSTGESSEFFRLVRTERAVLLLLDIDQRDPPAYDTAMLLNSDQVANRIPVLFLTVMHDAEGKAHVGAADFLSRPIGTGKLLSIVNDFLEKRLKPYGRVLVVEPQEGIRSSLVIMIRSRGDRVTEAAGAEEALVLAERFSPGLVVLNADMARARDFWLLRQLRRLSPVMEILVLADRYSEDESKEVMNRGATGYGETGKLPELLDDVQ